MKYKEKTYRLLAGILIGAALLISTKVSLAAGSEWGSLDSLASGFIGQASPPPGVETRDSLVSDLNAMLEIRLYQGTPLDIRYRTLKAIGQSRPYSDLLELWRKNNTAFLAKPAAERTGEGLIPDINVPLPGIGKVLGSGAQIKINGSEKITLGGQTTDYYGRRNTSYDTDQSTSSFIPKFKQEQQINLEGIIGERMHVLVDHNSATETAKQTKLRLYYEGKEDEILQRLEAGDTEFSLSGSSRIGGLTTQHKGLFGLKGIARLGGLELTAIASKDEGQYQSKDYAGSDRQTSFELSDKDYAAHRVFRIPPPDGGSFAGDSILDLKVFVKPANLTLNENDPVIALNRSWRDFGMKDSVDTVGSYRMTDKKVQEEYSYEYVNNGDFSGNGAYFLLLKYGLQKDDMLGIAYRTARGYYYPDMSAFNSDTDRVALLKPSNCQPPTALGDGDGYAWEYELRNFYELRSANFAETSLRVTVKRVEGNTATDYKDTDSLGRGYIYLLGIDNDKNTVIDRGYYRMNDGLFYFPSCYPFETDSLPVQNPAIYDSASLERVTAKYKIYISYLSNEAVYTLDVPGKLIEGSVKVTLNGEMVPAGQYQVDYDLNTVTFSEEYQQRIKQPGASLNFNYQFLPWASLGTKTLAGLRGVYKFSEKAQLGGTWLYRSEQSLETKPRLGEEPRRMIMAGLDGYYKSSPSFITSLADRLPLVETEAPSNFELSGEFAANFPNPNTRNEVFIDDMDGSKLTEGLTLYRQSWVRSSVPYAKTGIQLAARTYWYNPTTRVLQKEINPNLTDETQRNEPVTTLKIHMVPDTTYGQSSWAGITQLLSKNGIDLSQSKLLNVWVRSDTTARLHIDLGDEISLDQVWRDAQGGLQGRDGVVDGESLATGNQQKNVDANDMGMDGVWGTDAEHKNGDNWNDDYSNDSTQSNGTEKNGVYDTEDLKLDGYGPGQTWIQKNNYYSFSFDLSGSSGQPNQYQWRKFTIPLDSAVNIGSPDGWNNISFVRIWVDSCPGANNVELALAEVTGNRWQERRVESGDSTVPDSSEVLKISVKNNKDDADYDPPPNSVENDEQGHPKFEQSLVFTVENLRPNHLALAERVTNSRENNYTGYQKLRLWVHGEASRGSFILRLAKDTDSASSYYEYTGQLAGGWQELVLNLEDFSNLKKVPADSSGRRVRGNFSSQGSPSLTSVGALLLGIKNDDSTSPYYGEVWFDNLRLDEVRRDRGTVLATAARIGVADLATINLSYNRTGAYWYTMDQSVPLSPSQTISYNINGDLSLDKLALSRLGLESKLGFRREAAESYPWYGGDDIRLNQRESDSLMTWSRSQGYSLSMRKKDSRWWPLRYTLDLMTASISWSQSVASTRSDLDSLTSLSTGWGWGWSPRNRPAISLGKLGKLYYLPSSLSFSLNSTQTWKWNLDRDLNLATSVGSGLDRSGGGQISWQLAEPLNYSFSTRRNLMQQREAWGWAGRLGLGSEVYRSQSVDYHTTVTWMKVFQPSIHYNTSYNESHHMEKVSWLADSTDAMDVSNVNNLSFNGGLDMGKWMTRLTSLRNKAKDDSTEPGTPRWLLIQLEKAFKTMNALDISFTQMKNTSTGYLAERPGLLYQLGWRMKPQTQRYQGLGLDRSGITNTYSAGTGLGLGQLSLNGNWSRSDVWSWDATSATYTNSTTWPDLRASLNSVERLIRGFKPLASASLTSNYNRRQTETSQQGRGITRRNIDNSFSPLLSLNSRWKKQVNAQISLDYSTTDNRQPDDGLTYPSGWRKDYTRNAKVSASASYAFSAPRGFVLNLWKAGKKRVKFKSDLNLGLQASYANNVSAVDLDSWKVDLQPSDYSTDVTEYSLSPNATYNFSRSIKGELSGSYTEHKDRKSSVNNNRSYSLQANVIINF
jgi:hypothetical protein